ncbi:MAG: FtsX-like permease family protein [Ruminococcus sp.]|nr:FtsX-like permease family protein [Ruminococcus sp.]
MRRSFLLARLSLQYWRNHKRIFFTFLTALVLGVSALCCTALLIRSEKQAVLEEELRLLGDYDLIAYDLPDSAAEEIRADSRVTAFGKYYRLGYSEGASGARVNAAAFGDKQSRDIYHMTCSKGHYPENAEEVALDSAAAKALGISPYPGERLSLSLYSPKGSLISKKEYTVSGIFEASNSMLYGGWLRYPSCYAENEYEMPGAFFFNDNSPAFSGSKATVFLQADASQADALFDRLSELSNTKADRPNGRCFAYSYVLGNVLELYTDHGEISEQTIGWAVENGDTVRDFYSGILMPVFTAIVFIIVVLCVVGITGNIIRDRRESFAILSSLGLDGRSLRAYIACDLTLTAALCTAVGLGLGCLLHMGMISLLNRLYDLKLQFGFSCSKYVNAVTFSPVLLAVVTVMLCVAAAILISLIRIRGKTPSELLAESSRTRRRIIRPHRYKSWKRLIRKRIRLGSAGIALVSILVMGTALFGYTFFRALSDKNNNELKFEKEQAGLGEWDYKAEKSDRSQMYIFNIENHHDNGISKEAYSRLAGQPFVKSIFGKMVNRSTRIAVKEGSMDKDRLSALRMYDLRPARGSYSTTELAKADKEAEDAMISAIGYENDELIYSLPTVGLFDDGLEELEPRVTEGSIDLEKLRSGEEVLLVMTKSGYMSFKELYHAGDALPLSDIVLSDEEEQYDLGHFDPSEHAEPVYRKNVMTDDGFEVELTAYAFGERKDIAVKIGAVVVLDIDAAKKYMTPAAVGNYGMNAFCSVEAFNAWGLKDDRLTDVFVGLDDISSVNKADLYWYDMLSRTKGMTSHSTAEITAGMNRGTRKIMSVYYCMMIILISTAAVTIAIGLYTGIRIRSSKFAVLRACGMELRQIVRVVLRQNIVYPIVGIALSPVPVWLCQRYFGLVRKRFEAAEDGDWPPELLWIFEQIPTSYDLFSYNIAAAMAVIFGVYLVIILAVTLPQILYLKRQSIPAEIERSSF